MATRPHMVGVEEAAFKQRAVTDLISQVHKLLRARASTFQSAPFTSIATRSLGRASSRAG
jgi:hypothetical protein